MTHQRDAEQPRNRITKESPAAPPERDYHWPSALLITRLDSNPTKADWTLWSRDLDARLTAAT